MTLNLGRRRGECPQTRRSLPHSQLNQQPTDVSLREELLSRALRLPAVRDAASGISVPGAIALVLEEHEGPPEAFMIGTEFAHFHPAPDFSLHLTLPPYAADEVLAGGWGEAHYLVSHGDLPATHLMIYAPRDGAEVEAVWKILQASHAFARGSKLTIVPGHGDGPIERR